MPIRILQNLNCQVVAATDLGKEPIFQIEVGCTSAAFSARFHSHAEGFLGAP
jgi:hypothetical protein